jgi:hypothetical protein
MPAEPISPQTRGGASVRVIACGWGANYSGEVEHGGGGREEDERTLTVMRLICDLNSAFPQR